ncbi:DUF937 domain-containing protein [Aestuariimicrobium sp. Y1814]|uniref:DUF937 domain-containing protein n=1 Tax=Aestuariimicrobium sp. Y1814 TaxID=3418742 RepID=UPI003DA7125D
MSIESEILSQIDTEQLAQQLGTDAATAEAGAAEAIRALVGGMATNASDPQGERSLASALSQHAQSSTLFNTPGLDLDEVDQEDGAKIVNHVLGSDQQFGGLQAADTVAQSSQMPKLLKILAPIVLAYIAKQITAKQNEGGGTDILGQAAGGEGGGILGQILGNVLGGGQQSQPTQQQPGGGILGQILGGLLGR